MTLAFLVALAVLVLCSPSLKKGYRSYRYRDRVIDSLIVQPHRRFTAQDDSLRKAADERRARADKAAKEAVRIRTKDEPQDSRIRLVR